MSKKYLCTWDMKDSKDNVKLVDEKEIDKFMNYLIKNDAINVSFGILKSNNELKQIKKQTKKERAIKVKEEIPEENNKNYKLKLNDFSGLWYLIIAILVYIAEIVICIIQGPTLASCLIGWFCALISVNSIIFLTINHRRMKRIDETIETIQLDLINRMAEELNYKKEENNDR